MASKTDDREQELMRVRALEARVEGLLKHREFVSARIAEIEGTKASIEEIEKSKGETLFHVGGEAFMRAKPSEDGKIMVIIGADVAMEKTSQEARELLESRMREANDALREVQKEIDVLTKQIEEALMRTSHSGHNQSR